MDQHSGSQPGPSEGGRRPTGDGPGLVDKGLQRFSARRKVEIVLRLLRGEDLEIARLQQKLGEVPMADELLQKKIEHLEDGRPLPRRRLRR